jgi:hypothetical protein
MSAQKDDDQERRERELQELERVEASLRPRIDVATKLFSQAINCLLLGNSGGALATLGFIGTIAKDGTFPKVLLYPLFFFILGLVLMGIGILVALSRERGAIIRNQWATNIWDTSPRDALSPLQRVGLAPGDRRMIMALLSGCCFLAGCFVGFGILACKAS